MSPRANLFIIPLTLYLFSFGNVLPTTHKNDTVMFGSYVHEMKVKPSPDLLGATSKLHKNDHGLFHVDFKDKGFKRLHLTKDHDGYKILDTFHLKDGDGFGYEHRTNFNTKNSGGKDRRYHESSKFDGDDEAAGSVSPAYNEWHSEKNKDSPGNSYKYENNQGDVSSLSKPVEPYYGGGFSASSNKRAKRTKDNVQPAATEYDNYEYAEVEDADDAPADFEADEGADPEYANVEADAYDYY